MANRNVRPQKASSAKKRKSLWNRLDNKYKAIVISAAVVLVAIIVVVCFINRDTTVYRINVQAVDKTLATGKFTNSAKDGYLVNLAVGESVLVKANLEPINKADDNNIAFESTDSKIATATDNGKPDDESKSDAEKNFSYILITAVSNGETQIKLTNPNLKQEQLISVTVSGENPNEKITTEEKLCEKLKLSIDLGKEKKLTVGNSAQFEVTFDPEDTTDTDIKWTSSDDTVVKVNTKGKIEGISEGKATITAYLEKSDVEAEYEIEVIPLIEVEKIELDKYEITLKVGEKDMPMVTMLPEDCYNKDEIWESSDENVATVEKNGRVTAKGVGECDITVKAAANEEITAVCKVTVVDDKPANTITAPTTINGVLIVNKTYGLPADYAPGVDGAANSAFAIMKSAALEDDINLFIVSGYRSYATQEGLYEKYVKRDGQKEAERYSARPGYSEHQTGLAFDVNNASSSFAGTPEAKWLADNCYKYGFIIRYPEGKESVTGYKYEPWHIRYVGVDLATTLNNSNLTLEEYLGVTSKYAD
ncbi:MAG: D-alanyl-D-alanine carboxypeptidase family protein [Firmicutes bacterium]|nr:D-alanyl-D-alanine carboxypeptidase family protein [Bacillota bacterium]